MLPSAAEPWQDSKPTGIRLTMAKQMERAGAIPHFYLKRSFDASSIVTQSSESASIDSSVIYACAQALLHHGGLNAAWLDGVIRRFVQINVGFAVATERGLLVPVVHGANALGREAIGIECDRLISAARNRAIDVSDLTGGTFTITNVGRLGIDQGWPLVNPPQVAILAIGRVGRSPVVVEDAVSVQHTVEVVLAADHRAVDGAEASAFLSTFGRLLEQRA